MKSTSILILFLLCTFAFFSFADDIPGTPQTASKFIDTGGNLRVAPELSSQSIIKSMPRHQQSSESTAAPSSSSPSNSKNEQIKSNPSITTGSPMLPPETSAGMSTQQTIQNIAPGTPVNGSQPQSSESLTPPQPSNDAQRNNSSGVAASPNSGGSEVTTLPSSQAVAPSNNIAPQSVSPEPNNVTTQPGLQQNMTPVN